MICPRCGVIVTHTNQQEHEKRHLTHDFFVYVVVPVLWVILMAETVKVIGCVAHILRHRY